MTISDIKLFFSQLSEPGQSYLLSQLISIKDTSDFNLLTIREQQLNNKVGCCPHCDSPKYNKDGHEKSGVQRYVCKSCKRNFNPFTGTWLTMINKRELLVPYIKLMEQGLSLEKIKDSLDINKKTAFDWRHKICSSLNSVEEQDFSGITESDETFFLHSKKGDKDLDRKPRKRGGSAEKRGINEEQVAAIVTMDRDNAVDLKVSCLGRITKDDIVHAIGDKINDRTILCSDGHVSYKGFAMDNHLEHHVLKANIKQYCIAGTYHIQHVNSAHSRLKSWITGDLYGVATKYLQNYLNWFRIREKFEGITVLKKIMKSALDVCGNLKYRGIKHEYEKLIISSQKT